MNELTANEKAYCEAIARRFGRLRDLLTSEVLCDPPDAQKWYTLLAAMKAIQGNVNNDLSFVATILAKRYLEARFDIQSFDAAGKPQGAAGPDVEAVTRDSRRVIGEIKTTVPYGATDFGAAQKANIKKDLHRLVQSDADIKIMFVTDARAYEVLQQKYRALAPGVDIVLLTGPPAPG